MKGECGVSSAALAVCVGLLMWFSGDCLRAATEAAAVFASSVMPALFPMMVLAGIPFSAERSEKKRGALGQGLSAVFFGFAAGSPAGARRVAAMREAGKIEESQAARLFVAVGVMSPLFFLGALTLWTKNAQASLLMLTAHWLSALMVGGFLRLFPHLVGQSAWSGKPSIAKSAGIAKQEASSEVDSHTPSFLSALPGAISMAAHSLLSVCGAMMLFSIAQAIVRVLLTRFFPAWTAANTGLLSVFYAILEVGGGTNAVVKSFVVQGDHLYALLCALCSFGGLSIWMQNLTFAQQSIRPATLLLGRVAHGTTAYGVCRLILLLWPQAVKTSMVMDSASVSFPGSPLPSLGALMVLEMLAAFWQKSKTY